MTTKIDGSHEGMIPMFILTYLTHLIFFLSRNPTQPEGAEYFETTSRRRKREFGDLGPDKFPVLIPKHFRDKRQSVAEPNCVGKSDVAIDVVYEADGTCKCFCIKGLNFEPKGSR